MTAPTAWAHLPNAALIDRVLAECEGCASWDAAAWRLALIDAWDVALDAARDAAWRASWDASRHAARGVALDAAGSGARKAAWSTSRDAAWRASWDASRHAARGVALDAAGSGARKAAWSTSRAASWRALWSDAPSVARDACAALIAWDDCTWWLDPRLTLENMRTILDEAAHMHPAGVLLLPYKIYLTEVTKEKCK